MSESHCATQDCVAEARKRGMCDRHYRAWYQSNIAPLCSIEGCQRPAVKRSWCGTHYKRWRMHGDPTVTLKPYTRQGGPCSVDACGKVSTKGGMCAAHYTRLKRHGDPIAGGSPRIGGPCSVPSCGFPAVARRLCTGHYQRVLSGSGLRADVPLGLCSICNHPDREMIEDQYLAGVAPSSISQRFSIERHSPRSHMEPGHLARDAYRSIVQIASLTGTPSKRARDRAVQP